MRKALESEVYKTFVTECSIAAAKEIHLSWAENDRYGMAATGLRAAVMICDCFQRAMLIADSEPGDAECIES